MTFDRLKKLLDNNPSVAHELIVSICIACHHCDEESHIKHYGTIATDQLRETREALKEQGYLS